MGNRMGRVLLVLGTVLVVALLGLIVSGAYLKWAYRPTEVKTWANIYTLHADVTAALRVRIAHLWLARFIALVLPIYAVIFAVASSRQTFVVVGRRLRATALFVIVVGILGIVAASMRASAPMRHWYLVHETPAYLVLPALMFAFAVRPRARRNEPSTT